MPCAVWRFVLTKTTTVETHTNLTRALQKAKRGSWDERIKSFVLFVNANSAIFSKAGCGLDRNNKHPPHMPSDVPRTTHNCRKSHGRDSCECGVTCSKCCCKHRRRSKVDPLFPSLETKEEAHSLSCLFQVSDHVERVVSGYINVVSNDNGTVSVADFAIHAPACPRVSIYKSKRRLAPSATKVASRGSRMSQTRGTF